MIPLIVCYNGTVEELRDWLNDACERRNLSWRQASIRAGINPGAISGIMNGERPGLEVCKALAQSFGTSTEYVLRLAGHLPPAPTDDDIPPELRAKMQRIAEGMARLPEPAQQRIIDAMLLLLDVQDSLQAHDGTQKDILPQPENGKRSGP